MASTVTSTNNLSLRSILEKDKLTGSNFLDWERNLMIVLRHERKWYVLEEPLGEAPPANAPAAARNAHKKHSDDLLDVACLMLATMSPDLQTGLINTNAYDMIRQLRDMFQTQARTERYDATKAFNECKMVKGTSVSDHVMKMKRHLDHLERLGHPVPLQLATDTILNSLSEDYRPFVVNYNMNNMEKTIAELHSMLKTAELNMGNKNKTKDVLMVKDEGVKKKNGHASTSKGKGPVQAIQSAPKKGKGKGKGKKVKPNKARTENRCFICNEIGHWRQNCPKRHEAGSYDQLLNNSYKCCRLKVAQIFDRVANIGRDPRLRLLLGKSTQPLRRNRVAIKGVTRFSGSRGVKGRTETDALWRQAIAAIHGSNGRIGSTVRDRTGRSTWGKIAAIQTALDRKRFPRLAALDTDINCSIAERIQIADGGVSFRSSWRRAIREGREGNEVNEIVNICSTLPTGEEVINWSWGLTKHGAYSSASLRLAIDDMSLRRCRPQTMWNSLVPIKVRICFWRARLRRLPTKENLAKRGITLDNDICAMCNEESEAGDHTFTNCRSAIEVRRAVSAWKNWLPLLCSSVEDLYGANLAGDNSKEDALLKDVAIQAYVWAMWTGRNEVTFGNKVFNPLRTANQIQSLIFLWCSKRGARDLWLPEMAVGVRRRVVKEVFVVNGGGGGRLVVKTWWRWLDDGVNDSGGGGDDSGGDGGERR
ncbi:hypothetical protein OSB04_022611 [Centaurea solstitialis]|uniref:CCHC-type domain-containing protein n=1 Tax=Centaurea solstitialis TaxID=347529 RepID=A0AA38T495_9ASTR|nr:hypothetical protein OSB04_022611 [Centaurea solstitialis]